MTTSLRIERDRQALDAIAIDSIERSAPDSGQRMLGQVIDGGSFPTAPNCWCLTNPGVAGGAETEGGTPALVADTNAVVPVLMIGSALPDVGDWILARMISGKWVASKGASASLGCGPCAIPKEDLTITISVLGAPDVIATLVYSKVGLVTQWLSECTKITYLAGGGPGPFFDYNMYRVRCLAGSLVFEGNNSGSDATCMAGGEAGWRVISGYGESASPFFLNSITCSPFKWTARFNTGTGFDTGEFPDKYVIS